MQSLQLRLLFWEGRHINLMTLDILFYAPRPTQRLLWLVISINGQGSSDEPDLEDLVDGSDYVAFEN